jgi:hypothetical protein
MGSQLMAFLKRSRLFIQTPPVGEVRNSYMPGEFLPLRTQRPLRNRENSILLNFSLRSWRLRG